jgi:hypothetical protein
MGTNGIAAANKQRHGCILTFIRNFRQVKPEPLRHPGKRMMVIDWRSRVGTHQYPEGAYPQGATQMQAVGRFVQSRFSLFTFCKLKGN